MRLPHWAKVAGVAAALFIVCQGPFVLAWLSTPPGYRFTGGNLLGTFDTPLYWWWMEQGRAGAWAVTSPFTTEPQLHGTFMPLWAGLGHLGRLSGIPSRTLYVAATLVGVWLALLVVDWLAKAVGFSRRRRLVAVLLAAGAGGFGWVANLAEIVPSWRSHFQFLARGIGEVWEPGMTLSGSASMSPHFPLLEALLGLTMLLYLWQPRRRWLALVATAATVAVLGTLRPYSAVLVFCLYALLATSAWWLERPAFGEHLARLVAVGVGAALPAAYFVWLVSVEPVFAWWVSSNVLPSANPLNYLLGWGLVAALVVFGLAAVGWAGLKGRAWRLAALWVAAPLVLLYVPFSIQRRAIDGWFIPVAVVAAVGWRQLASLVRQRWVLVVLGSILALTTVTRSALLTWAYRHLVPPLYSPPALVAATDWLQQRCAEQPTTVLVDFDMVSMYLPYQTGCYQFTTVGGGERDDITIDYDVKSRLAEALFTNAPTSTSADRAWLASSDISYVFTVKALPLEVAELQLAWERGGIRIYKNRLGAATRE